MDDKRYRINHYGRYCNGMVKDVWAVEVKNPYPKGDPEWVEVKAFSGREDAEELKRLLILSGDGEADTR